MIVTTAIMSRILTPAEVGLFLTAHAIVLVAEILRDLGISHYIVQKENLERRNVQCAFTLSFLFSITMGILIFVFSNEIAVFFGDPGLADLLEIGCLGFVIVPFGGPIFALLRRDLRFQAMAGINVTQSVTSTVLTIGLGLLGVGPASYMWASVIANSLQAAMAFIIRPDTWIYRPTLSGAGEVVRFGFVASIVTIATLAQELMPRLILGRMLNLTAVGIFSRALSICQLPERGIAQVLTPVVLPALAAHTRAGGELREAYLKALSMVTAVQWPALAMLAILADPAVQVLLGDQWGEVPPLVRIAAIASMALAPNFLTYPVLIAAQRINDTLTVTWLTIPICIAVMILAAPYGLTVVALSLLVTSPFQMAVALHFLCKRLGMTWREVGKASVGSLIILLTTAAAPLAFLLYLDTGGVLNWWQVIVIIGMGGAGWGAGLLLTDHPLKAELQIAAGWVARKLRPDQAAAKPTE